MKLHNFRELLQSQPSPCKIPQDHFTGVTPLLLYSPNSFRLTMLECTDYGCMMSKFKIFNGPNLHE